jgi:hypothetical protein
VHWGRGARTAHIVAAWPQEWWVTPLVFEGFSKLLSYFMEGRGGAGLKSGGCSAGGADGYQRLINLDMGTVAGL